MDSARALDDLGLVVFASASWLRAARVCQANEDVDQATLAWSSVERHRQTPMLRLLAYEARARRSIATGDVAAAKRAVDRGYALLESSRALFESTELRARSTAWGSGLAEVDLQLGLRSNSTSLFRRIERWRRACLPYVDKRPVDAEIRDLLGTYRACATAAALDHRDGAEQAASSARLRQAEQALTTAMRSTALTSRSAVAIATESQTRRQLGGGAFVQLVEADDRLVGVVTLRHQSSVVELGSIEAIARTATSVTTGLRRLTVAADSSAAYLLQRSCVASLHALRNLIATPMSKFLIAADTITVAPPGRLYSLPWSMLLGPDRPVTVVPSATHWITTRTDHVDGRVVLAAGPSLTGAAQEVAAISTLYEAPTVLMGDTANARVVLDALEGAAIAHLACHGDFRSANPLFSALRFADGPLIAHDLDAVSSAPRIVVLSACSTALAAARGGSEILGLSTVLLQRGTTSLVAATVPIDDRSTIPVMLRFHQCLTRGDSVSEALVAATSVHDAGSTLGLLERCAFSVFGRGDLRLRTLTC